MKNIRLTITILTFSLIHFTCANAQSSGGYLKVANKFFKEGNSYAAAVYYEKYLQASGGENETQFKPYFTRKNRNDMPAVLPATARKYAMYNLAESYRLLNDYANAEKWYSQLSLTDRELFPLVQYWYGIALRANGKQTEAQNAFQLFLSSYNANDAYTISAQKEMENFSYVQAQKLKGDSSLYKIVKSPINGKGATYAATVSDDVLYFTSTRPDTTVKLSKEESPYINNLYETGNQENTATGIAKKLAISNPKGFQQGTITFAASGKRVCFTRWQKVDNVNRSAIYTSTKSGDSWTEPTKLSDEINVSDYNSKEPFVTSDGHLIFSSDRPGGVGKFDLWAATIDSNGSIIGQPVNLGPSINSPYDDQCPFYHQATGTLVFASNGRLGMGGFDLYTCKGTIGGEWQAVVNPGYPVNSVKDDLYFTTTSDNSLLKKAFISSDRNSACCLELFSLEKEYKKYITGTVVNCETNSPVADAMVQVTDSAKGRVLFTQLTDADGRYVFDVTTVVKPLKFVAEKQGYNNATINGTKATESVDTTLNGLLCLTLKVTTPTDGPKPNPMLLHFDFDKFNIRGDAAIVLDSLAAVMLREPGLIVEIGGYTDSKGTEKYNLNLSNQRAQACFNYLVKNKGISANRFSTKGYGECCHIGNETTEDGQDNPEGRQLNRRAEFKITGF